MLRVVLLAADPDITAKAWRALASTPGVRVAGHVHSLAEAQAMAGDEPEVVLVDLESCGDGELALLRGLAAHWPDAGILAITANATAQDLFAAVAAGARGFLLREDFLKDCVKPVFAVNDGGSPLSPRLVRELLTRFREVRRSRVPESAPEPALPPAALSGRQGDVLGLLSRGFTYREIARLLGVTEWTIGSYCKRVYRRLDVRSRSEAVFEAHKLGLLR